MDDTTDLVQGMRQAARYIHSFWQQTVVLAIPGELVQQGLLPTLAQDIALLKAVGIRVVLVHGIGPQVEEQLALRNAKSEFHNGIRITDAIALECVKEVAGENCLEIEAAFSQGLANTPMANATVRVLSGNLLTAQPLGIIDGIDYQYTGVVRKIDTKMIRAMLDANAVVLLSPLGCSPTGETFNLTLENVAQFAAAALSAQKLIFLTEQQNLCDSEGQIQNEWVMQELRELTSHHPLFSFAAPSIAALKGGVERVHFVPFNQDGALLIELLTQRGSGIMVTEHQLDRLRRATIDDVGSLLTLIEPLETEGILVKRSRQLIEQEIEYFTVIEHDGILLGCAALYPFADEKMGEMACLTVLPDSRNQGEAKRLLHHIENRARQMGIQQLFVLTTRTAHWFIKRGFRVATIEELPQDRKRMYNWQRKSQVLIRQLN